MKELGSPEVKLVLNGGKNILDSATVPVEWHFSDDINNHNPQKIVVIDISESQEEMMEDDYIHIPTKNYLLIKPTELVSYIQIQKPGVHNLIFIVSCGPDPKIASAVIRKCLGSIYLYPKDIEVGRISSDFYGYSIYFKIVEFEIPKELFAKRSETPFGNFVWRWTNRWYSKEPADQCAYRKRKFFAFTAQPILLIIGRLITGIFGTVYGIVLSIILLLTGFRPILPHKFLYGAWINLDEFKWSITEYEWYSLKTNWRWWGLSGNGSTRKYMPIYCVPIFIPSEILMGISFYKGVIGFIHFGMINPFVILEWMALVISSVIILMLVRKVSKGVKEYRKRRPAPVGDVQVVKASKKVLSLRERRTIDKINFLKANASIHQVPNKVDVNEILKKVNIRTQFKLSFWATKAKVCRPFAR